MKLPRLPRCIADLLQGTSPLLLPFSGRRRRFCNLFLDGPVPMFLANLSGSIIESNKAFLAALAIPDRKSAGNRSMESFFLDPEDHQELMDQLIRNGEVINREVYLHGLGGGVIIVLMNLKLAASGMSSKAGKAGKAREYEGSFTDVTSLKFQEADRKKIEELELRERHMHSINRLAAGIAHDINNILGGIHGHAQVLRMKIAEEDGLQKSVDRIIEAVSRAATITHSLLTSIGALVLRPQLVELGSFLREKIGDLQEDYPQSLELMESDHPLQVSIDPAMMGDLLREVLSNASKASPPEEIIRIVLGEEVPGPEVDHSFLPREDARCAYIAVIDNGAGMDDEVKKRIFEPYFTSDDFGHGAGIGMTRVYGTVSQHKGAIEVQSYPGSGTSIIIFLPLQE